MPGTERLLVRLKQRTQAAKITEQLARQVNGRFPAHAGAQEDRQQLRIRERGRTAGKQLLTRSFSGRPVANRVHGIMIADRSRCAQREITLPAVGADRIRDVIFGAPCRRWFI